MAEEAPPTDPFAPPAPEGMGRRQFVKTAMGVAVVGAVGTTTAGLVVPLSTSRLKIRRFPYLGAKKVGGPAPQGIPLIPLKVKDGFVEGVPELKNAGVNHNLDWYKYCAHEGAPGLEADFTADNVLRYFNNPAKVKTAEKELGRSLWYADKLDQKIEVAHFTEVGMGAPFRWRSEGQEQNNIVTGIVIRVDPEKVGGKRAEPGKKFIGKDEESGAAFIAFCSFCAHFCCVPGFKESKIPLDKGLFEKIYCTCHDSVYDPLNIHEYTFPPDF